MSAPDRRSLLSSLPGTPRPGGVTLSERSADIACVLARRGAAAHPLLAALPPPGRRQERDGVTVLSTRPGGWLFLRPGGAPGRLARDLAASHAGIASVSDQSSGHALLTVAGPQAGRVLSKCCRLDLSAAALGPQGVVATQVAHVPCTVMRSAAADGYDLLAAASFALWLAESLAAAAGEYGWSIAPQPQAEGAPR